MINNEEKNKKVNSDDENIFSTRVKAGRRVYFLDVKSTLNGGTYLSITETRKKPNCDAKSQPYIRQTIFIYPEDFDKFEDAFSLSIQKIKELNKEAGVTPPNYDRNTTSRSRVVCEELSSDEVIDPDCNTSLFTLNEEDLGFE